MTEKISKTVDTCRDLIIAALDYIRLHPETGYREKLTSAYMAKTFEDLGYNLIFAGDIPGFYTVIDTGKPGPEVLVLGELDSIICPAHPDATPETGAAHCCGHNAQCAALIGVAAALTNSEITANLCGRIRLCAIPAEELIEISYRLKLREKGTIKYLVGKPEFLRRGYFDGVDLAFMVHTTSGEDFVSTLGSVGCIAKYAVYKGVSSHAGGAPWEGKNALYAASLGLSALNSIRETFKESDLIRVHPIITEGGSAVNVIPDRVVAESFVRGASFEAIKKENNKVNRAFCGAALSLGANIEISDIPGYAPLNNSVGMISLAEDAARAMFPDRKFKRLDIFGTGSTDMGDLSAIMPVVHPFVPGATGISHGADYKISNSDLACVDCAKWQVMMLYLLLSDNGRRAKQILSDFKPLFTSAKDYLDYIDSLSSEGDRIIYNEDGTASVKILN